MKTIAIAALAATLASGQEKVIEHKIENKIVTFTGPVGMAQAGAAGPGNMAFGPIHFTQFAGETVKGAPYSADSTTETIQTLADGNRIVHKNTSSFARDGAGRTRTETRLQTMGGMGQTAEPVVMASIFDPVGGEHYSLNSNEKTARKFKLDGSASATRTRSASHNGKTVTEDIVIERRIDASTPKSMVRMEWTGKAVPDSGKTESLGTQTMEGVVARGTRQTVTIPAGAMGNERPMEIVTETWRSDELHTNILTRHSDPRMGETTTRMTNIRKGEPPASLFEIPSDYKVVEAGAEMPRKIIQLKEDR
jgi:hypothetical protein